MKALHLRLSVVFHVEKATFEKNYQVNTPSYTEDVPLKHQLKQTNKQQKKPTGWKLRSSITC